MLCAILVAVILPKGILAQDDAAQARAKLYELAKFYVEQRKQQAEVINKEVDTLQFKIQMRQWALGQFSGNSGHKFDAALPEIMARWQTLLDITDREPLPTSSMPPDRYIAGAMNGMFDDCADMALQIQLSRLAMNAKLSEWNTRLSRLQALQKESEQFEHQRRAAGFDLVAYTVALRNLDRANKELRSIFPLQEHGKLGTRWSLQQSIADVEKYVRACEVLVRQLHEGDYLAPEVIKQIYWIRGSATGSIVIPNGKEPFEFVWPALFRTEKHYAPLLQSFDSARSASVLLLKAGQPVTPEIQKQMLDAADAIRAQCEADCRAMAKTTAGGPNLARYHGARRVAKSLRYGVTRFLEAQQYSDVAPLYDFESGSTEALILYMSQNDVRIAPVEVNVSATAYHTIYRALHRYRSRLNALNEAVKYDTQRIAKLESEDPHAAALDLIRVGLLGGSAIELIEVLKNKESERE